jgi:hypothetical protein
MMTKAATARTASETFDEINWRVVLAAIAVFPLPSRSPAGLG